MFINLYAVSFFSNTSLSVTLLFSVIKEHQLELQNIELELEARQLITSVGGIRHSR